MFRKVHFTAVVAAVLGAALGYPAATGHLDIGTQTTNQL
jgi:hypothetical protein